jgi:SHS2 domain-containing protein
MAYKFLEHTADVKILVEEENLEKAFSSSAYALREVMLDFEKIKIKSVKSKLISVDGKDLNDLLYNFLEEFIYLFDAEGFILSEIEDIEIIAEDNYSLTAKIMGDKASAYKFINKVKAITFYDMFIKEEKNLKGKSKFKLQFVLDV